MFSLSWEVCSIQARAAAANARSTRDLLDFGIARDRSRRTETWARWLYANERSNVVTILGEENLNARKVMRITLYASRCSTQGSTGNQ